MPVSLGQGLGETHSPGYYSILYLFSRYVLRASDVPDPLSSSEKKSEPFPMVYILVEETKISKINI